jgi:hypothetical protein
VCQPSSPTANIQFFLHIIIITIFIPYTQYPPDNLSVQSLLLICIALSSWTMAKVLTFHIDFILEAHSWTFQMLSSIGWSGIESRGETMIDPPQTKTAMAINKCSDTIAKVIDGFKLALHERN